MQGTEPADCLRTAVYARRPPRRERGMLAGLEAELGCPPREAQQRLDVAFDVEIVDFDAPAAIPVLGAARAEREPRHHRGLRNAPLRCHELRPDLEQP